MALHRSELDDMTCQSPGCDHTAHDGMFLHSACHPTAATWAEYQPKTGLLRVTCAACDELLAEIAVAP
jgi:hypothetical protein